MTETVYIPSIDGKDLYLGTQYKNEGLKELGYCLNRKDGSVNFAKYINTLDYSLDRIKLEEVVGRKLYFTTKGKYYSNVVINVTFKYSVGEFNHANKDTFVRLGYSDREVAYEDCIAMDGDKVVGIILNQPVTNPVDNLPTYFEFTGECYVIARKFETILNTAEIRAYLYKNGCNINGKHYIRWKRSSGSSRVGKCLFIEEKYYKKMHQWEMCGLKVKDGDKIDLAALEAYISLPLSSIIDTIEINPKNILIIDDYESVFNDDVVSIEEQDGSMVAVEKNCEIHNSIWDGQGLIDPSAMGVYSRYGMVLLRNLFFKCCCFNCNIQQWFADNGITDISQLNGKTQAECINDIKLITTPSSIKYVKFGTIEQWIDSCPSTFGVVKHDKPTHYLNGRLVQTHYQLLNTLQMTRGEVSDFLRETFDYMRLINDSPAVLRHHIKYQYDSEYKDSPLTSKNDIVYKMLGITDKFAETKIYDDFKHEIITAIRKNTKQGHILVNGNYSTLLGNPMEMLLSVIGKFDGMSQLGVGNVHCKRFAYNMKILGTRSPHISMNSVWTPYNVANDDIDKYFNLTNEIIAINAIGENVLNILSGCDFDSDAVMVTDNQHLIKAALKNNGRFKTAINNIPSSKRVRHYTAEDKADLDARTSNNLIGDLINLSQELNTAIWHSINTQPDDEYIHSLYMDVCILNVASQLEIDKAKKEFPINNSKELMRIRSLHTRYDDNGVMIKPNFFMVKDKSKGYFEKGKKNYMKHETTMDYVQDAVQKFQCKSRTKANRYAAPKPFSYILQLDDYNAHGTTYTQVTKVLNTIRRYYDDARGITQSVVLSDEEKILMRAELRKERIEYIKKMSMSSNTMCTLLKAIDKPENSDIGRTIFYLLFAYPNEAFYSVIQDTASKIARLEEDNTDGNIKLYGISYRVS